jgi:hypothetical protein
MLDTTPPVVNVVGLQIYDTRVTISWSGFDNLSGIDHYEIRLDEGAWINIGASTNYTFENLSQGVHIIYIRAVDKAGNINTITHIMNTTQTTTTFTTTVSAITTYTTTITTTETQTIKETTTVSVTTTQVITITKVETTTITQTDTVTAGVIGAVALIIGLAISLVLKKK